MNTTGWILSDASLRVQVRGRPERPQPVADVTVGVWDRSVVPVLAPVVRRGVVHLRELMAHVLPAGMQQIGRARGEHERQNDGAGATKPGVRIQQHVF
jgi:hypothetical protein